MRSPARITKAHGLTGLGFLKAHIGCDDLECLLLPYSDLRTPTSIKLDGRSVPAARQMCKMAHGTPSDPNFVARHLCGRGHWSCVNPTHLRWGSCEENSNDTSLHHRVPKSQPRVERDLLVKIEKDNRHYNIIAVDHNIPSAVVRAVQDGAYFITGYRRKE